MFHFFFDLDGTLTDSAEGITRCIAFALAELGATPPPHEELGGFIGTPLPEIFRELLDTDDDSDIQRAIEAYGERYYKTGIRENRLYAGVREGLESLRAGGASLYIATAKSPRAAEAVVSLFALGDLFRGVYGVDRERTRDKAALLREVVAGDIDPAQSAMIGDRHYDIAAGRAAGMTTVWAGWGYGSAAERDEAKPDVELPDFAALTAWAAARLG